MIFNPKHKFPPLKSSPPTIDSLYPGFTLEERAEAEEFWKSYVALVWRIYRRIRSEKSDKI